MAKHRAKIKGMAFDLVPAEIQKRVDHGTCEVTGIAFDLSVPKGWNSPSLDQIVPGKGYTPDNTRVVLFALNIMANVWGLDPIIKIGEAISRKRRAELDWLN